MKKFITLVATALMTLPASAEVIYSWQSEGPDAVQQVGGTATAMVDEARVNYANTCNGTTYYTICLCGKKSTYPESAYVNITLDTPLAEGDVISVTAYRNKNEVGKNSTVEFLFDGNKDNSIASTEQFANIHPDGEADAAPSTQTFTVPASAAGCTFFDMTRGSAGTNLFITKLEITREGAAGAAFAWEPMWLTPSPSYDIFVVNNMGNVSFNAFVGEAQATDLNVTDVMPVWIDEDGNELKAVSGEQDPWGWGQQGYFTYTFDISSIKANGEYTLVFPEGMLVNAAGEKSVKMVNYYTLNDVELAPAMFDDFEVLSVTPELSQPQAIWNNQIVTINTNHNDAIGFTKLIITDLATEENIVYSTNYSMEEMRQLGESSPISWTVQGEFKFIEDHIYRADFTFYNGTDEYSPLGDATPIVAKATFDFAGRVEAYKYSSETLLGVEPAPGVYVISDPSQAVFTYTFSGPVSVYKAYTPMGQNGQYDYPVSYLSSNDDKTVWTLDLSESDFIKTLDAALPIAIRARDLEGYQLQGNFGEEALSSFEYEWECELGAPAIEILVPAKEAVIERLTEVVVKSVDGAAMEYVGYPAATIQSRDRSMLGELYYDPDTTPSADGAIHFTMWYPEGAWEPVPLDLDAEGVYSIFFPHGAFQFGEQFEAKQSHSAGTSFEISNGIVTPPSEQATFEYVSVDPASGSTVASLETIVITFPENAGPVEWTVNVYKEGVEEPVAIADVEFDPIDWCAVDVKLREPITSEGTYTIIFKEGVIGNDPYCESNGATGICNPEFKLTYIVSGGSAVGSVEAADAGAVYYDLSGRRVQNPDKGIYIVNGKKVVK